MNDDRIFTHRDVNRIYDVTKGRSVSVPEGYTSIGECAFYSCLALENIKIPKSVTSIGPAAFQFCSALESIVIPASVESIGNWAFVNCSNLKKVTFEEGSRLKSIGSAAFHGCDSLESIELPPCEINGIVTPVNGIRLQEPKIFSVICTIKTAATPIASPEW